MRIFERRCKSTAFFAKSLAGVATKMQFLVKNYPKLSKKVFFSQQLETIKDNLRKKKTDKTPMVCAAMSGGVSLCV